MPTSGPGPPGSRRSPGPDPHGERPSSNGLKRSFGRVDANRAMSEPEHFDAADVGRPRNGPPRRRASDLLVPRPLPRPLVDKPRPRESGGWLERWMATVEDLARLKSSHPMLDAVIDEQDGRRIRIGDHWLADFASCNYLGLDLDPEIIAAVPGYLARWGTHPSWSRMLASPVLNERIDAELAALLGAEDVLTLPTITHISGSVLPVLADQGTVYLDARAHKTIWDGCQVARGHGATVRRFAHDDPDELEALLRAGGAEPRVVCTDGVNSMTGNPPPLRAYLRLVREYDALLYVDDGHGFGVVGERAPDEPCPYGRRGNGVVRHLGESY